MVPPSSHRVSRVRRYSGYSWLKNLFAYRILTFSDWPSHAIRLKFFIPYAVRTPNVLLHSVWPLPRSLATTDGISVDFSSSPYLDVSVQAVPLMRLWIQRMMTRLHLAGLLHSEIHGLTAPRGLSQLVTSFIGSRCQGIPLVLFVAWPLIIEISLVLFP